MKESQIFQQGSRGCFISFVMIVTVLFAMAISTKYQYPEHPSCAGMLGAGFPVLFICDDWGGGSPTSSWGKITFIDIPNGGIRPTGFLIDFLFYSGLIWVALFVTVWITQKRINPNDVAWAVLVSLAFITGFLCASLTFLSSRLYLGEYDYRSTPTPILPSPTALGTMPASVTPSSTLAP